MWVQREMGYQGYTKKGQKSVRVWEDQRNRGSYDSEELIMNN